MKDLTRLKGYTDQMVEDANAIIFTFGSYRLGVRGFYVCMGYYLSRSPQFYAVCSKAFEVGYNGAQFIAGARGGVKAYVLVCMSFFLA